jgi:hypothetical protein
LNGNDFSWPVKARKGEAGHGKSWLGGAWQGWARRGVAGLGEAGRGTPWQTHCIFTEVQQFARQGVAWLGWARHGKARQGTARHGKHTALQGAPQFAKPQHK